MEPLVAAPASVGTGTAIQVYTRRWYILLVFSVVACLQGWQWASPGGIPSSLEGIYGSQLTDNTIQLFLNYGCIFFIPSSMLFGWWLDQPNGLRGCTVTGYALVVLAAVLRLVSAQGQGKVSLILLHLAYIVNAIAGPVAMGAVSKLSENWFPPKERTTATAIAAQSNLLGTALAFVVGPLMVPHADSDDNIHYILVALVLGGVGGIASLVYFPSRPPLPPSISAATSAAPGGHHYHDKDDDNKTNEKKEAAKGDQEALLAAEPSATVPISDSSSASRAKQQSGASGGEEAVTVKAIFRSIGKLFRNRNFLVLLVAYGLAQGMSSAWGSTLTLNLQGITGDKEKAQSLGGWVSFTMSILGVLGSLVASRIVDRYSNHRTVIAVGLGLAALFLIYFSLLAQRVLPPSINDGQAGIIQIFAAGALSGMFMSAIIPILFEIAVESTFSIAGEGLTVIVLTLGNNVGGLVLLAVPLDSAAAAFNWIFFSVVAGSCVLCVLFLSNANERSSLDIKKKAPGADSDSSITPLLLEGGGSLSLNGAVDGGSSSDDGKSRLLSADGGL